MKTGKALGPILAGFFVMGFCDIVGTVMNQIKAECKLDDVTAGFLPSMIFVSPMKLATYSLAGSL